MAFVVTIFAQIVLVVRKLVSVIVFLLPLPLPLLNAAAPVLGVIMFVNAYAAVYPVCATRLLANGAVLRIGNVLAARATG